MDEDRDGAPGYYSKIDDPIDMQTIEFKLRNNIYMSPSCFHGDMRKMWSNSREYNCNNKIMLDATNSLEKRYFKLLGQHRPQ